MVGESQLKRFMQSVETVMDNIKKPDPAHEAEMVKEAEEDKKTAETIVPVDEEERADATVTDGNLAAFNDLLTNGAKLLTALSRTLTQSGQSTEAFVTDLVTRDEKTGRQYLKIPLPEKDVLRNIASTLGRLFQAAGN